MIELNQKACQELGLTYWQLNNDDSNQAEQPQINREEKELLRKILLAKAVTLDKNQLEVKSHGVVVVNLKTHQLIFDDVRLTDSQNIIHLSKIADMLTFPEEKKLTWYKLKGLDF